MSDFYDKEGLVTLTGFSRKKAQIAWLKSKGYKFELNGRGEILLCLRYDHAQVLARREAAAFEEECDHYAHHRALASANRIRAYYGHPPHPSTWVPWAERKPLRAPRVFNTKSEYQLRQHKMRMLRLPSWADKKAMRAIYKQARRITLETGIRHAVDHIIPLQGKRVSGLHVPENLRIITHAENAKKLNKYVPDA